MTEAKLKWACADGGPHLLLPARLLASWSGAASFQDPPAGPIGGLDDYQRACEVVDPLGRISVADGFGLVLGDEVPMSTWLRAPDGVGVDLIIPLQWSHTFQDEQVIADVGNLSAERFRTTALRFETSEGGAVLLPACDAEPWVYGCVDVDLAAGTYAVSTVDHDCDGARFRVHRLTSTGAHR